MRPHDVRVPRVSVSVCHPAHAGVHRTVKVRNERQFLRQIEQATGVEKPFCQAHKRRLHAPTVEAFRKKWDELEGDKEGRKKLARDSAADAAVRREVGTSVRLA